MNTAPNVVVCDFSASRSGLPPMTWVTKTVGWTAWSNTRPAGTPVASHNARTAAVRCDAGPRFEQGSVADGPFVPWPPYSSPTFGARIDFCFWARNVRELTGAHSEPMELVQTLPTAAMS